MKTIYIGDVKQQEKMLLNNMRNPATNLPHAVKLLHNRINKHFGLTNKYAKHVISKFVDVKEKR